MPPQKIPVMPVWAMERGQAPRRLGASPLFQMAGKGIEQLGCREHALDLVIGRQNRHGLLDDVFLVGFQVLHPAFLDELDDPAWIEIDTETDAAAVLAQVLHCQSQAPRTGWAEHEPVGAFGEILVRQRLAEKLVVDAKIIRDHAAFRNARRTTGLENIDRLVLERLRHPAANGAAAQPFVLEQAEKLQVGEPVNVLERVEGERLRSLQPERGSGVRVKMPANDITHVSVEPFASLADFALQVWCHGDVSKCLK